MASPQIQPRALVTRALTVLIWGALGAAVVVAGAAASGHLGHHAKRVVVRRVGQSATGAALNSGRPLAGQDAYVSRAYRKDSPGVVDVFVTADTPLTFGFFGLGPGTTQTQGEGAGVVYDTKGDILTDAHVISGATSITVTFQDGERVPAKVVGSDPSADVAVIRVSVPASQLHPIAVGNSAAAQVGDPVLAIGSPFGLPETTTHGIISAVRRTIQAPNGSTIKGALQTDAAINPGNSGGPLLDAHGRMLGLVDQIATNTGSGAGIGFAVPANTVGRIADAIIASRSVSSQTTA